MRKINAQTSIEYWLEEARAHVIAKAPDLTALFNVYSEEAKFGRRYINPDLMNLPREAEILEVGAGSLLLSCQLVREGFKVTALEPTGEGFSHFERLRAAILEKAAEIGCAPIILDLFAENLREKNSFDYAFSVNVMEHVNDVRTVVANVNSSLRVGSNYRFICPNYSFPYEPHFNIPTLFSKKLTEKIFGDRIFKRSKLSDPVGTWKSLNWITASKIKKIARDMPEAALTFNKQIFVYTLERIAFDKEFASRRSKWVRLFIFGLLKLRLHRIAAIIPVSLQPIIDCNVTRIKK